nr:urea carboxylase-associated family protein [Maliibacterium massiliense]
MQQTYTIDPCSGRAIDVRAGQTITVTDVSGGQVADFFAEALGNPDEFLSTGVTIDCNASLALRVGDYLYTNRYRPMFQLLADDVGAHDLLHPCCRREMYDFFYHNGEGHASCLDNINHSLGEQRPIIHPWNIFMHTRVLPNGEIRVEAPRSKAGACVVLRAAMDARLGIAACSVCESSCNSGRCTAIQVTVSDAPGAGQG